MVYRKVIKLRRLLKFLSNFAIFYRTFKLDIEFISTLKTIGTNTRATVETFLGNTI